MSPICLLGFRLPGSAPPPGDDVEMFGPNCHWQVVALRRTDTRPSSRPIVTSPCMAMVSPSEPLACPFLPREMVGPHNKAGIRLYDKAPPPAASLRENSDLARLPAR